MKQLLTIIAAFITINASAQDTTKKDSVKYVPVYIIDKTDTIQRAIILWKNPGTKQVMYEDRGYLIVTGKATVNKEGKLQYVEEPRVTGALLSDKKRRVEPIL